MRSLRVSLVGRVGRAGAWRRRRRGAVLVMATATMAGLMVITAIAVDLSRLHVMRTELQTAADASALAAATRLNEDRSRAAASAIAAVNANPVRVGAADHVSSGPSADIDSVRFGLWQPSTRTFVRTSSAIGADAVQVTVSRAATYLLGRFISGAPVRVTARATAWSGAPAMRANCVSPFFMLHHDYMRAFGKKHDDMLTHEDIRTLRDTATNKRWMTVRLNRTSNRKPAPGAFYGMVLPTPYSGQPPRRGNNAYRKNIADCNTMERGWVAQTEEVKTTRTETFPGLNQLCKPLAAGVCYNGNGGIGVPITVSIFCTGPEHTGGNMWFQVEWMTGFMLTGSRQTSSYVEVTGYLIPTKGTGEIRWDGEATGLVRTILVR